MEWQVFAIAQMVLITLGVSVALGLRIRAVNQQNRELRAHFEATASNTPESWVQQTVDAMDDSLPHTPLVKAILFNALKPNDAFVDELPQLTAAFASNDGQEEQEALRATIADLEQKLAEGGGNPEQTDDLKALLQQFTRDSREMMACIQALEQENAELRQLLGDAAPPARQAEDADNAAKDADSQANEDQVTATSEPEPLAEDDTTENEAAATTDS